MKFDEKGNIVSDSDASKAGREEKEDAAAKETPVEVKSRKMTPQQRFKSMAKELDAAKRELREKSETLEKKITALEAEKSALEAKAVELEAKAAASKQTYEVANDNYTRLNAEFDNYRRRTAKEKLELRETAAEDIIKGMLPVLDDCIRALDVLSNSDASEAAIEGTQLIYNKLWKYLSEKGLAEIESVGKELDTDFHEAVAQFPVQEEEKKNRIIDVAQRGYTLNGKVIRYAKVVVGI